MTCTAMCKNINIVETVYLLIYSYLIINACMFAYANLLSLEIKLSNMVVITKMFSENDQYYLFHNHNSSNTNHCSNNYIPTLL